MNRRELLTASGALGLAATLGFPSPALAAGSDLRFLFLFAEGGWDPTRVFVPGFDLGVSMEADAELWSEGDLSWVTHPARPAVDAFFASHGSRTTVLNGLQVPSVAHPTCERIVMTGSTAARPDWAAILAGESEDLLPGLVVNGPTFPGPYAASVARLAGRRLSDLVSGRTLNRLDTDVDRLPSSARSAVDDYVSRRIEEAADSPRPGWSDAARSMADAHTRARQLKDIDPAALRAPGGGFESEVAVALDALEGISRCATVAFRGAFGGASWDSHANNDTTQSQLFQELFTALQQLMFELDQRPGRSTPTLAEETVVVVLSEMGRTPLLNDAGGKDHWPWTSAMLVGPRGAPGGRVIGQLDAAYAGRGVDPASGEVSDTAPVLTADALGATLLAMGDVDPASVLNSTARPLSVLLG